MHNRQSKGRGRTSLRKVMESAQTGLLLESLHPSSLQQLCGERGEQVQRRLPFMRDGGETPHHIDAHAG